jgi:outer membrane lipoprotein SlyB
LYGYDIMSNTGSLLAVPRQLRKGYVLWSEFELGQRQDAKVVDLLAVLPAKVEVGNQQAQATARLVGGLLGVMGGAVIGNSFGRNRGTNALFGGGAGGATGLMAASLVPETTLVEVCP